MYKGSTTVRGADDERFIIHNGRSYVDCLRRRGQMRARYDMEYAIHDKEYKLATTEQMRLFHVTLRNNAFERLQKWA